MEWHFKSSDLGRMNVVECGKGELRIERVLYVVVASIGVLNAIVFGMDKETLKRLNWVQMKVCVSFSNTFNQKRSLRCFL